MSTQERKKMQEELIRILLKKAALKKKSITELALKIWAWDYMELFNEKEIERYKSIIL